MKVKCADVCMNCANWDEEKLQKRKQQQQQKTLCFEILGSG